MDWNQKMDHPACMFVYEFAGQVAVKSNRCNSGPVLYREIIHRAKKEGVTLTDEVVQMSPRCYEDVNYGLLFQLGKEGGSRQLQAAAARLTLVFSGKYAEDKYAGEVEFILFPPQEGLGEWMDKVCPILPTLTTNA